jgi:hypothetical protein
LQSAKTAHKSKADDVAGRGEWPFSAFTTALSAAVPLLRPASAYVRYITRSEVCRTILGERMPIDSRIYAWLDDQEKNDRKNARVVDRVIVALPAELSRDQNIELLQAYGERLTEGRASWMAAIHDGPRDADSPHAHMVFRDRDIETGRRVMLTSEAGSTERLRQVWEEEANLPREKAGL